MKRSVLIIIGVLLLCITTPAHASILYSLVDDWSNTLNPNGVWSYNEGNNPLPYNVSGWPLGEFGGAQTAWANGNEEGYFIPGWFKSVNVVGANGPYDWLVEDVIVHSTDGSGAAANPGLANVTWTSPIAGLYDIYGGLWEGRETGRSNDWNLYLNDSLLTSGSVSSGDEFSRNNPNSFLFEGLSIEEGDILKLEVVRTSGSGDFVGVDFNIASTAVPEPVTMFLFSTGLVGFAAMRRKK